MVESSYQYQSHDAVLRVAHLTTVDLSLRFLLWPQLLAVRDVGGKAIGISSPGPWVGDLEEAGIEHLALRSSTRGFSVMSDFRAARQLWKVLRSTRLTILHTHNPKPGIYGRILGRLAGVPIVVNTLHGFYATETDTMSKRTVVYGLEAIAARFSDAELHQNPEDLRLANRLGIVPAGRGRLLGNGIDLSRFDPSNVSGAAAGLRDELGAGPTDVVIGAVGRLVAEKGFLELFEVAKQLGEGYVFVVIGPTDTDKSDAISNSVVEQAKADGIRFLGMRTDMEDLYSAMDLFVLPSHREGFPRAAMEAAAMGLPVIATDIRGCRQVVDDGVNGKLVPLRDPVALATAIRTLAQDNELRATMSSASRRIAEERFDEREVVSRVMGTYGEVLQAKGMSHLIPKGMLPDSVISAPHQPNSEHATVLANLHFDLISGGFLPTLGRRFMRVLYRGLLDWPGTRALIVEDDGGVTAFVVAVEDIGAFYRWFIKNRWLAAGLAAIPAVLNPATAGRAWESFRYGGNSEGEAIPAEILSLGVAPRARGRGLSRLLLDRVVRSLGSTGHDQVKVVVGSTNLVAIAAYEKAGFVEHDRIEVHQGESSEVLVWRPG